MPGLRNIAIHWYRRVFGAPAGSDIRDEGLETVLDGNSAVALSEAAIASHAVQTAEGPRGIELTEGDVDNRPSKNLADVHRVDDRES